MTSLEVPLPTTAEGAESTMHLTDLLLIGSNLLIIIATIALTIYTAKAAHETARQVSADDSKIIRMLIRRNRQAKHAKRVQKAEAEESAVRRIS